MLTPFMLCGCTAHARHFCRMAILRMRGLLPPYDCTAHMRPSVLYCACGHCHASRLYCACAASCLPYGCIEALQPVPGGWTGGRANQSSYRLDRTSALPLVVSLAGGVARWELTAPTGQWSGAVPNKVGGGRWGGLIAEGAGGKWWPARNRKCVVRTGSGAWRAGVVRQLDRVKDEEPYSELYPRVCERLSDSSRVTVFGFKGISSVTAMFPPSAGCLLHTSFSLGACAIAVHITGDTSSCQMLWECQSPTEHLGKGEMSE